MTKTKVNLGGRPASYPFDKWTNGDVHVIDYAKMKRSRQAVTEALRRHSRKLGRHCNVYRAGNGKLKIQFLDKD